MTEPIDAQVAEIDSAIEASEPIPENLVGWRIFDSRLVHAHGRRLVGAVLRDLGFIDLTYLEEVARKYARGEHPVLAEVRLPAGTKVVPMFQVMGSDEGDLLVARGSSFIVREVGKAGEDGVLPIAMELLA